MEVLTGIIALALALTHLSASRIRCLSEDPRSCWLSLAGGVSVAYVFVHVLPELQRGQETLEYHSGGTVFDFLESHAYLVALLGLGVFYGLEVLARRSKRSDTPEATTSPMGFWLHIGSFSLYNLLIGYLLLHREVQGNISLVFYAVAMGTHFLVNDLSLNRHHQWRYRRYGRWVLSAAILLGWVVGLVIQVNQAALALFFALLAGAVVMNVLKEELPETQQSRFWPFGLGAAVYSTLLVAMS